MNNQNIICELVVTTYDLGSSLSEFVAEVVKIIRSASGVKHILTPMGTIIEGDWEVVMQLIDRIFKEFADDYERLSIQIKIDYRRSKSNRIEGKIKSVEDKLTS